MSFSFSLDINHRFENTLWQNGIECVVVNTGGYAWANWGKPWEQQGKAGQTVSFKEGRKGQLSINFGRMLEAQRAYQKGTRCCRGSEWRSRAAVWGGFLGLLLSTSPFWKHSWAALLLFTCFGLLASPSVAELSPSLALHLVPQEPPSNLLTQLSALGPPSPTGCLPANLSRGLSKRWGY